MYFILNSISLKNTFRFFLSLFLFVLPWQTIWIYRESYIADVKWEYGTLGFFGSEILLWICIFLFIILYLQKKNLILQDQKFKMSKDRIFLTMSLLCIVYLFASIAWASDRDIALQQSVRVIEAFLLCTMLISGLLSKKEIVWSVALGSIVPAALGIFQFFTQSTFSSTLFGLSEHIGWRSGTSVIASDTIGRWLRAYGPFSHPNVFGGYIVMVVSLLLASNQRFKVSLQIIYGLLIIALFFTFSRGAWIAFGIFLLIYYYFIARKYYHRNVYNLSFIISSICIFTVLSIVYLPLVQTRFAHESPLEIRSTTERLSGIRDAGNIFLENMWLGVGIGNYTVELAKKYPNLPGYAYQPVHTVFILFIVECGIIGSLLLVAALVSFISFHISRISYQDRQYVLAWYIVYGICYAILASLDHYLFSSYVGLMITSLYFSVIFIFSPVYTRDVPKMVPKSDFYD